MLWTRSLQVFVQGVCLYTAALNTETLNRGLKVKQSVECYEAKKKKKKITSLKISYSLTGPPAHVLCFLENDDDDFNFPPIKIQ